MRIGCGNLEFFKVVEDVELGQVEGGIVIDSVGVLDHHEIKPTTASFTASCYPNFMPDFLQLLAYIVELFGRKGTTGLYQLDA